MKTKINGILTLLLALMVQMTFAQERTISGVVSDEMGPVADISVKVKGTTRGTVTDFDGNYAVKAKTGDTLEFTHVSYTTVNKVVGASSKIDVLMKESGESLEEVVVSGYGVKRAKPKSSVAVQTVTAETIEAKPNASLIQTLQGQVAGMEIVTSSGQPGSASEINLRGVGSVSGETNPLFVVDGMVVSADSFSSINSNEIASLSILKDAGATAIYGSRGANGVVIINTKRGKFNTPLKINVVTRTGFTTLQGHRYDLMNAEEELLLERSYGSGVGTTFSSMDELKAYAKYQNTDWEDIFFRTGKTQDHNISLSMGGDKMASSTSIGYFQQDGVLVNSDLKRFSFRNNIDGKSKNEKFTYQTNVSLNYTKDNSPGRIGSGVVNQNLALAALTGLPHLSPNDYTRRSGVGVLNNNPLYADKILSLSPIMLLDKIDEVEDYNNELRILAGFKSNYKLTENLTYRLSLGGDYTQTNSFFIRSPWAFNSVYFAQFEPGNDLPGYQSMGMDKIFAFDMVNSLNYNKTFNDIHTIDVSVYGEYFKAHRQYFGFTANGLDPRTYAPGDGSGFVDDVPDHDYYADEANAAKNAAGTLSYFLTFDYDFNSRFGFSGSVRRDASYRFLNSNKWATFYSVSGRWNIDKEKFMENSSFDMLKLRASYGTSGNQRIRTAIGPSAYFTANDLTLNVADTGTGYGSNNSIGQAQLANKDLKWETVRQTNIGIDYGVFKSKLRGAIDVYKKTTEGLFQRLDLPSTSGFYSYYANNGELVNKGIELSINAKIYSKNDFDFSMTFVGAYNKQERYNVTATDEEEGGKLDQFYSYLYAGVNPSNGNLLFYDIDGNLTENPNPETDRVFTHKNRYADYQGSFGFETSYKGFFLSSRLTYAIGRDRWDGDYQGLMDRDNIGQFRHSRDILDAWTPDNRITNVPSLNATNIDKLYDSDMYLFSADYLRVRNLTFGYNVPKKYIEKLKLRTLQASLEGENLLTLSGWKGNDVEGNSIAQYGYPTPKIITMGLKIGF